MNIEEITPLILTYNEAPNIGRALQNLKWASRIIVVDSQSTDSTVEIANSFPNVRIVSRAFDEHTNQWNFGLDQIESKWVLTLDADYVVPDLLRQEIALISTDTEVFYASFLYCVYGRKLRASLYPPRAVLFGRAGRDIGKMVIRNCSNTIPPNTDI